MMVSTSASATTPSPKRPRSQRLSSIEASTDASVSPYASGGTDGTAFSGASSRTSQTSFFPPSSPVTPRPMSSRSSRRSFGGGHRRKSSRASIGSFSSTTSQLGGDMGLGNLADELAEADVEEEHGTLSSSSFLEGLREGDHDDSAVADTLSSPYADLNDVTARPSQEPRHRHSSSNGNINTTPTASTSKRNRRSKSTQVGNTPVYDGSDYGPESDSEGETPSSFPPLLGKRIRSIERLVHDCSDVEEALANGGDGRGGVISHLTQSLHSLGPTQANIEYGVTRMLTACNSIATHRTHAQRDLFSTSHTLMYGHRIYMLPAEMLDLLASELDSVSEALPVPPTTSPPHQNPLVSLSILANDTSSLISTLRSLTDLLQETRLAANAATRKLKSVRDMVEELRVDEELVENSMLLIQAGDWDRRCRERQAASVCQEVVRGFGERWGIDIESSSTGVKVAAA